MNEPKIVEVNAEGIVADKSIVQTFTALLLKPIVNRKDGEPLTEVDKAMAIYQTLKSLTPAQNNGIGVTISASALLEYVKACPNAYLLEIGVNDETVLRIRLEE